MALIPSPSKSRRRPGMTLVELLVACAIGFGLLLLLHGAMAGSASRFQAGESGLEANLILQRVQEYIRKDLDGPFSMTPCHYPDKIVKAMELGSNRIDFALRYREVEHKASYYRDGEKTKAPTQSFRSHMPRVTEPKAPCQVVWYALKASWISQEKPSPPKVWQDVPKYAHMVENVPESPGGKLHRGWVIGPSLWSFDPEEKVLLRWTLGDDPEPEEIHSFGEHRLLDFTLDPIMEWAQVTITDPPPIRTYITRVKTLVRIRATIERDEGRPPLSVTRVLLIPCCP